MSKPFNEIKYGFVSLPDDMIVNLYSIDAISKKFIGGGAISTNKSPYYIKFKNSDLANFGITEDQFLSLKNCLMGRFGIGNPDEIDYMEDDDDEDPDKVEIYHHLPFAPFPPNNGFQTNETPTPKWLEDMVSDKED